MPDLGRGVEMVVEQRCSKKYGDLIDGVVWERSVFAKWE